MKQFIEDCSIQIYSHFEKLLGAAVGVGAGVSETANSMPNVDTILDKMLIIALYAFIGGIFGGLAKWLVDWVKGKIIAYYEQKRKGSMVFNRKVPASKETCTGIS